MSTSAAIKAQLSEVKIMVAIAEQLIVVWEHADNTGKDPSKDAIRQSLDIIAGTLNAADNLVRGINSRNDGMKAAWEHLSKAVKDSDADAAEKVVEAADKHGLLKDEEAG